MGSYYPLSNCNNDAGGSIGPSIVITAAEWIVTAHDRTLLVQYGGHINLTRDWVTITGA